LSRAAIASGFARRLRGRLFLFIAFALRLCPTIRAVGVRFALFDFLADRSFAPRFDDRISDRFRHQLYRPNCIIVASDRNRDQIRISVGIDQRDDRNIELVPFVDGDSLLLGIDDEHEAGQTRQVLDAAQILRKLVPLPAHHQLFFLGVVLEITTRL
jgi:hypothetical protein